jgi:hypothetical protein
MPTICEIKMELKELGVKGITGKNKAELMAMLEHAKAPKVAPKAKKRPVIVRPAVAKPVAEPETPQKRLMAEIKALVEEAKAKAREGASAKELTDFYNKKISPKIDLYGAEYLGHGGASEIADELFEEISAEYRKHTKEEPEEEKPKKASPPPIIPKEIKKDMKQQLLQDYDTHEYKMGLGHPIDDMVKWFRKVQGKESLWGNYQTPKAKLAYNFIYDLIQWVSKNSHKVQEFPFGTHERTELALLDSDWEDFWKANK